MGFSLTTPRVGGLIGLCRGNMKQGVNLNNAGDETIVYNQIRVWILYMRELFNKGKRYIEEQIH